MTQLVWELGGCRFGFTHDIIENDAKPYLERWIIWFGFTLRIHKFLASDDDRAVHDHPWWFLTIPLHAYQEYTCEHSSHPRRVRAWRPHFRRALFRHRVELLRYPSWTLIITGPKTREWGFWHNGRFVHNLDWPPAEEERVGAALGRPDVSQTQDESPSTAKVEAVDHEHERKTARRGAA